MHITDLSDMVSPSLLSKGCTWLYLLDYSKGRERERERERERRGLDVLQSTKTKVGKKDLLNLTTPLNIYAITLQ